MPLWAECVTFSALILDDPEFCILNFLFLFFILFVIVYGLALRPSAATLCSWDCVGLKHPTSS